MGPKAPKRPGDDDPYEENELDEAVRTVTDRADETLYKPAGRFVKGVVADAALEFLQEVGEALKWRNDEEDRE